MKAPFVILFLLCIVSCATKTSKNRDASAGNSIYIVDIEGAMQQVGKAPKLKFSDLIDSIVYTPLQTGSGDTLVDTKQGVNMVLTDSYFLIGGKLFDRRGRFMSKLGRMGSGLGEYIGKYDEDMSEDRKEYYILANFTPKILVYDLNNNFLRELPVTEGRYNMVVDHDNIVIGRQWGMWRDIPDSMFFEIQYINPEDGAVKHEKNNLYLRRVTARNVLQG